MILAATIMVGIVMIVITGLYQSFKAHVRRHGLIPVLYRWFSGRQHHGISKDSKLRYRSVYDPTHQGYQAKIRIHKALQRTGWTIGPPVALFTWLANFYFPATTFALRWDIGLTLCILMLAGEFFWRMTKIRVRFKNDKTVARPLHRTLAPVVGHPLRAKPGEWINIADDRSSARALMPKNYHPNPADRTKIGDIIRETVGMPEDALITWTLKDNASYVDVKAATPPPDKVTLEDIYPEIERKSSEQIVLGLGRGSEPVKVSLAEDSPHFGLSIAGGGGKSQLAKLAAAQVLRDGGIVLILDVKKFSHAWADGLPNVRYARETEEIHEALIWAHEEINRRTNVAKVSSNLEGEVLANVGPRLLIIAEELNQAMVNLRRHWMEIRGKNDPKKSPAIDALEEALFMGRQVKMNMFAVAQMMTALAAGSGAARENMGIRILGRYTRNNWRMLVPEFDMPPRSVRPGRIQVVTSKVQECQVAFLKGAEAREMALSGTVTAFPEPLKVPIDATYPVAAIPSVGCEDIDLVANPDAMDETVTIAEAVELCPGKTLAAIRKARDRGGNFPASVGRRGSGSKAPHLYRVKDIRRWYENA